MFAQLLFPVPEIRHGGHARNWLTTLDPEGKIIPRAIFHHTDDGQSIKTLSPFRFSCQHGRGSLVAIGQEACLLLLQNLVQIEKLISDKLGSSDGIERRLGTLIAEEVSYFLRYRAISLVLEKKSRSKSAPWQKLDQVIAAKGITYEELVQTPEAHAWVRTILEDSLHRHVALLGLPELEEPTIRVENIELAGPIPAGPKKCPQLAVHVDFTCNIKLQGPWNLGRIVSKGAGSIRRVRAEDVRKSTKVEVLPAEAPAHV